MLIRFDFTPKYHLTFNRFQELFGLLLLMPTSAMAGKFVRANKATYPVALDPRGEVGKQFGARALPTTSILGPDGALAAFAYGPRRWDGKASLDLIDALRARSP